MTRAYSWLIAATVVVPLLSGCSEQSDGALITQTEETPLVVPGDAAAEYFIVNRGEVVGNPTIVTRRDEASDTTYSRRIFNCASHTWRNLGTGSTLEEMNAPAPDGAMQPILPGSIAESVAGVACK